MKTDTQIETTIETDPIQRAAYSFDPEHTRHIAEMLRDNYSDPHLAVVREYSANATDAHVLAGVPEKPIEIWLPTTEDLTFKVRDFGLGLGVDEARKLLFGYGSSGEHKRQSDDFIGGFGIGAKCALAVCDQFSYTIWHQGRKYIWNSFLDGLGDAQADLIYNEPSDEPSGIEVSVPVQEDELSVWHTKVQTAFEFYKVQPVVHHGDALLGMKGFSAPSSFPLRPLSDQVDWTVRGREHAEPILVMGGIGYPIDFNTLYSKSGEVSPDLSGFVLFAPVGFVKLAPSREALRYNRSGKEKLKELLAPLLPDRIEQTLISSLERDRMLDTMTEMQKAKLLHLLAKHAVRGAGTTPAGTQSLAFQGMGPGGLRLRYSGTVDSVVARYSLAQRYVHNLHGGTYQNVVVKNVAYATKRNDIETVFTLPPDPVTQEFKVYKVPEAWATDRDKLDYWAFKKLGGLRNSQLHVITVPSEDWDTMRSHSPWLREIEEVTETELNALTIPNGLVFSETQIRRNGLVSRSVTQHVPVSRTKLAQHSASCFALSPNPDNNGTRSSSWDVVSLKDKSVLAGEPLILIDRFVPQYTSRETTSNNMGLSISAMRGLLRIRPSLFAGKTGKLYAVRVQDAQKEKAYAMKPWATVLFHHLHNQVWVKASPLERELMVSVLIGASADRTDMNLLGTSLGHAISKDVFPALYDRESERVSSAVWNALVNGWSDPKVAKAVGAAQERWLLKSDAGRTLSQLARYGQQVGRTAKSLDRNEDMQKWFEALPSQWDKDMQATLLLLAELQDADRDALAVYRALSGDNKAATVPDTTQLRQALRDAAVTMLDVVPNLRTVLQTAWYAGGVAGSALGSDQVLDDNRDLTSGFSTDRAIEQTCILLQALLTKQKKKER